MKIKKNVKIFFLILISVALLSFIFFQFKKDNEKIEIKPKSTEELVYNSNIIENVNYKTRDVKGMSMQLMQ